MLYGAVEELQEQVDGLEQRQSQLMGTMLEAAPGASEDFDVAGAAAKGLAGFGAGAATGAAAGAFLGPGAAVTATGGAVIGAASAIASDVAKEGLGTLMSNRPGGQADTLEGMYLEMAEMYEAFLEARDDHGGATKFGGD